MLNSLVKVTLSNIDGINEDFELFIESVSPGIAIGHTRGDKVVKFDMRDIVSLSVVEDEDAMQEFVSDMLMNRKDFQISEIAAKAVNEFTKIIQYCPETYETLLEQLHGEIETMIEGYD
jgi:hypothetical protein